MVWFESALCCDVRCDGSSIVPIIFVFQTQNHRFGIAANRKKYCTVVSRRIRFLFLCFYYTVKSQLRNRYDLFERALLTIEHKEMVIRNRQEYLLFFRLLKRRMFSILFVFLL
jgi:hypothetical protein